MLFSRETRFLFSASACFFSFALRLALSGETRIVLRFLACLFSLAQCLLFSRETRFLFSSSACFFSFAVRLAFSGEARFLFSSSVCFLSFALRLAFSGEARYLFSSSVRFLSFALRLAFSGEARYLFSSSVCLFSFALRLAFSGKTRVLLAFLACFLVALCFLLGSEMSFLFRLPCRRETRLCRPASNVLCRRLTNGLFTVALRLGCCEIRLLGTTARFNFAANSPLDTRMPVVTSTVPPSAQNDHDDRGRERKTHSGDDGQHLHD